MFEVENQFYQENRESLREKYLGKAIVIVGKTVIGSYNDIGEAYRETLKTREPGTFCLKNIPEDPAEAYTEDHPRLTPIRWPAHA
jgi:hypothetical protein